jgi:hypothetical protein
MDQTRRLFDEVIVGPTRKQFERAIHKAIKSANGRDRPHMFSWPLADLSDFQDEVEGRPEGHRQWVGGRCTPGKEPLLPTLFAAWWSDHSGRRHIRLVAGREEIEHAQQVENFLFPTVDEVVVPYLAQVYPDVAFARTTSDNSCRLSALGPGSVRPANPEAHHPSSTSPTYLVGHRLLTRWGPAGNQPGRWDHPSLARERVHAVIAKDLS